MNHPDPAPIQAAALQGLTSLARAILETGAVLGADAFMQSAAGETAAAIAHDADACFQRDLAGEVVPELDAKGLDIGKAHVATDLATFAQGGSVTSPIKSISLERVQTFTVPLSQASIDQEASGKLTVLVTYVPEGAPQKLTSTIAMKVAVHFEYVAPVQATPGT